MSRPRSKGAHAAPSSWAHCLSVSVVASLRGSRAAEAAGHGRRPRHSAPLRLRINPLVACLGAVSLVAGGAATGSWGTGGASADAVTHPEKGGGSVSIMSGMANAFASAPSAAALPPASAPPAPAPPSLAGAPALRPHEIFGFAP